MTKLTRYLVPKSKLFEEEAEPFDPLFTHVYLAADFTHVYLAAEVDGTGAMPYDMTREQQLELQRNNEIKENDVLRAKLEATDNDVRVLWIRIEELRAEIERLQSC